MEIERHVVVPGPSDAVFALLDDLDHYPSWMDLVHDVERVEAVASDPGPAWEVELQARVGPFARSKRLRMVRTVHDAPHAVVFERAEIDGRRHAEWTLRATLADADSASVDVSMRLTYGGNLWTGAVLQRVLDDHVERGAAALVALRSRS